MNHIPILELELNLSLASGSSWPNISPQIFNRPYSALILVSTGRFNSLISEDHSYGVEFDIRSKHAILKDILWPLPLTDFFF